MEVTGREAQEGKITKGHKETCRCDMFIILIEEIVSRVFYIF